MSPENIRQPITIVSKTILYENKLKFRFRILSIMMILTLITVLCCPVLISLQIRNLINSPAITPIPSLSKMPTKTMFSPTNTARVKISTPTPRIKSTVTSSNSKAKISCADNLYKVNLRRTPGYKNKSESDSIYEIPCGEYVELLGDTKNIDNLKWWKVKWKEYIGWIADHTTSGKVILIFDP